MSSAGKTNVVPIFAKTVRSAQNCAKKVLLERLLPAADHPVVGSGVGVRAAEASQLKQLAEEWERAASPASAGNGPSRGTGDLQAIRVKEGDFAAAVESTIAKVQAHHVDFVAKLGRSAPPLVLFGAAVSVPVSLGSQRFDVRARVDMLRYNPAADWWTVRIVKTSTDPSSPAARRLALAEELLITGFLVENFHRLPQKGAAHPLRPMRVANVGVVHPWPHFPGPISLQDFDRKRLNTLFRTAWLADIGIPGAALLPGGGPKVTMSELLGVTGGAKVGNLSAASLASSATSSAGNILAPVDEKIFDSTVTVSPAFGDVPNMIKRTIDVVRTADGTPGLMPIPMKVHLFDKRLRAVLPSALVDNGSGPENFPAVLDIKSFCTSPVECPFYAKGYCLPAAAKDPLDAMVTAAPLKMDAKLELWRTGVHRVSQMTPAMLKEHAAPKAGPFFRAAQAGKVLINKQGINSWVAGLRYPAFFLDFEAGSFCLPPFRNVTPYTPVPFQFSMHVFQTDVLTEKPAIHNFLHFGDGCHPLEDPREALLAELMRIVREARDFKRASLAGVVPLPSPPSADPPVDKKGAAKKGKSKAAAAADGDSKKATAASAKKSKKQNTAATTSSGGVVDVSGCFVAHSKSYEERCLAKMANLCDSVYKKEIKDFKFHDTIDLMRFTSHPLALGSLSMKALLPAFLPNLKYNDLGEGIKANGDNAAALYRLWIGDLLSGGHVPPATEAERVAQVVAKHEKTKRVREGLLEYCEKDTHGMWELVRVVHRLANDASFGQKHNVEFFV